MLDEGRNRRIGRLLAASGIGALRLAAGPLALGGFGKAAWRTPHEDERQALSPRA